MASADEVRAAGRTLGGISDDLARTERDLNQALSYFEQASLQGHAAAQGIGNRFEIPTGLTQHISRLLQGHFRFV